MALDATKITRGVTGILSVGPAGTALPTAVNSALNVALVDLGWVGEDGVSRTFSGAADREVIRGWQNNGIVMVIRTPSEDNPTLTFVLLETKKEVIEFALETTVTASATDGKYVYDGEKLPEERVIVLDVVHGSRARRTAIPRAVKTEIGDQVFAFGEPIGWEITIECERDTTINGHFVEWDSAMKTP